MVKLFCASEKQIPSSQVALAQGAAAVQPESSLQRALILEQNGSLPVMQRASTQTPARQRWYWPSTGAQTTPPQSRVIAMVMTVSLVCSMKTVDEISSAPPSGLRLTVMPRLSLEARRSTNASSSPGRTYCPSTFASEVLRLGINFHFRR